MSALRKQFLEFEERRLVASFLASRSEKAFLKLYRRYTPVMYQFSLRLLGGKTAEAEEVVQEVWVRAVQRLHSFKWQSSFKTWLNLFVINCCHERRRSLKKISESDMVTGEPAAGQAPGKEWERVDLEQAISRLPEGYRQVLILHDLEGYKHSEIAEFLGIAAGTSKSQLFQARKAMRDYLKVAI
jgi:RNA polymerase sigma-70 factor (ECF subfamily)